MNVLLISSSRLHGSSYLGYCKQELEDFWQDTRELLFIPFALQDHEAYTKYVQEALAPMGFKVTGADTNEDLKNQVQKARGIFIGGGNTFLLTHTLYKYDLLNVIREQVQSGELKYMGSSAGSNVACPTMKTTNDMPIVYPPSFDTLNLVPFQINAHYYDPPPDNTHKGETRAERLKEFHQWNAAPVLGLREGALVRISGKGSEKKATLQGVSDAKLFRANEAPVEYAPGSDLSFLL